MSFDDSQPQDVRFAAETLYRNVDRPPVNYNRYNPRSQAHLDLINLVYEDYIAGHMHDGRMSVVRRFFCLFVIFDLFIISLLWLILIMLNGDNIYTALRVQVLHYKIETSMFDVVVAALFRCLILSLFYGIIYINHWFIIAFTTTGSCGFIIAKVFYYNWSPIPQPVIQVVLIVASCVLAWGEAWFLDFRVLPQEKNAQRFYRSLITGQDERSPLLVPYLRSMRSSHLGFGAADSSIGNFYSPIESLHNSDSEDDDVQGEEDYKQAGLKNVETAYELLQSTDWKLEKNTSAGDKIQWIQQKPYGKIYRLTAELEIPAKFLFRKLIEGVNEVATWNPTVIESRILKRIDKYTNITYQVSAPGGKGLVDSRDFVNLHCWRVIENGKISADDDLYDDDHDNNTNKYDTFTSAKSPESLRKSQKIHKSMSLVQVNNDSSVGGGGGGGASKPLEQGSIATLSRSLGAKAFSDEAVYNIQSGDEDDDCYVDAQENQSKNSTTIATAQTSSTLLHDSDSNKDLGKRNCDKMYLASGKSIEYERMPTTPKYTRGENLVGCMALRELNGDPNSCVLDWLLCIDLKGYFPRYILNSAYTTVMQEFMYHLRIHCDKLKENQLQLGESASQD